MSIQQAMMRNTGTCIAMISEKAQVIYFEPTVEVIFRKDSYGYRPGKSALDAIGEAKQRCWKYDYVIEFDIKGLFDNIDHELSQKYSRL